MLDLCRMFPGFRTARYAMKMIRTLSNLRQIGLGDTPTTTRSQVWYYQGQEERFITGHDVYTDRQAGGKGMRDVDVGCCSGNF